MKNSTGTGDVSFANDSDDAESVYRSRKPYLPNAPEVRAHFVWAGVLAEARTDSDDIRVYMKTDMDRSFNYEIQPLPRVQAPPAFTVIEGMNGVPIAAGVVGIIAYGGMGKSPLARMISDELEVSTGRRSLFIDTDEALPWSDHRPEVVAADILAAYMRGENVVVDSLKSQLFSAGNLGSGGINKSLFNHITQWGSMFAAKGLTLVVTANALTSKPEIIQEIAESLNSGTNEAIWHDGSSWRYKLRDYDSDTRLPGQFRWDDVAQRIDHSRLRDMDDTPPVEIEKYKAVRSDESPAREKWNVTLNRTLDMYMSGTNGPANGEA